MRQPLFQRRVLDSHIKHLARHEKPWGIRVWLGPILTLIALIAASRVLAHEVTVHGTAVAMADAAVGVIGDLLLLAALVLFTRSVATDAQGWRRTFGFSTAGSADLAPWRAGVGITLIARVAIGVVANDLTHGRATKEASNLHLHDVSHLGLSLLIIATLVVAPIVEELMFRGVVLRAFMRRLSFWGSAARSGDRWSRGLRGRCGHDDLELDRGQSAQRCLSSASVVGAFDPGDDGVMQLVAAAPTALVEDVLLQQREEGL